MEFLPFYFCLAVGLLRRPLVRACTSASILVAALIASPSWSAELPAIVDFNFHIRPIFSDRCFACHGPDAEQRQAELRLDTPEGAFRESEYGESSHVIKPGDPAESEVVLRIMSSDDDVRMPPPSSHLSLSASEKALIRRWIEQGAAWKEHWAFLPIDRAPPPTVQDSTWPRNAIDRFVLAELQARGLSPTAEASRQRLARRLCFDLTGLPPTIEQLDEFLADDSPRAYERLVDRLLASPRYGERMAVDWLDVARYADTYGYQSDVYRRVWPWRDWVVKAFNENLPYDDFVTWQLAGDLLPNANDEQILATAFNRLHRQTNEGGSIEEEYRVEYVVDRTDTFGVAMLGLSLGCARCHDHKFDPISQQEYYQLAAFFDNIDESGLYSHFTDATPTPSLLQRTEPQRQTLAKLRQQIAIAEKQLVAVREAERDTFNRWLETRPRDVPIDGLIGDFTFDQIDGDQVANLADAARPGNLTDDPKLVPGVRGTALRLSGENSFSTAVGGDFSRHDPFSIALWIRASDRTDRAVVLHRSRAWTDAGSRGYQLLIEDGQLSVSLIHFWPGNAVRVRMVAELPVGRWAHVAFSYDGSSRAAGLRIYLDGQPVPCDTVRDVLTKTIRYGEKNAEGEKNDPAHRLTLGQRMRDRGFKDGLVDQLKIFDRELTGLEVAEVFDEGRLARLMQRPSDELTDYQRGELLNFYLQHESTAHRELVAQLAALRAERDELLDTIPEIMVMRELDQPRRTFVLERGAYDAPREEVFPDVPTSILPADGEMPHNRLDLARWLTSPNHPLTARVAVNRFWQGLMGRGLVPTQEDFGSQGELPSHPQLLDWLARSFVETDWDVKALVKLIVMSATYRQDSDCTPEIRHRDPENVWLARGPRYRWPAEMIRDGALLASGLLVDKQGGPPVKPYQPPGLWKEKGSAIFARDTGEGSRRRSLYTYWKRSSPPPAMMTFDTSDRDVCLVRRQTTATPLQSLVLLNDPQYVEAARALAERAMLSAGDEPASQIDWIYRALISRRPTVAEQEIMSALLDEQLTYFAEYPAKIDEYLAIGDHQPAEGVDRQRLAAISVLAATVMNLDECVVKR